jgi:hypothetical protein
MERGTKKHAFLILIMMAGAACFSACYVKIEMRFSQFLVLTLKNPLLPYICFDGVQYNKKSFDHA